MIKLYRIYIMYFNITIKKGKRSMSNLNKWKCPKCNCEIYDTDMIRTTGGAFSKLFNVQNKRFDTISCRKCGYTEFYKRDINAVENIIDFLFGN